MGYGAIDRPSRQWLRVICWGCPSLMGRLVKVQYRGTLGHSVKLIVSGIRCMIRQLIPPLICLIGLVAFLAPDPTKHPYQKEAGRITFAFGLLACLVQLLRG